MHDGRFNTIDQVIGFYSTEIHSNSPNLDPLIEFASQGGVQLNPTERSQRVIFINTIRFCFIHNPKLTILDLNQRKHI